MSEIHPREIHPREIHPRDGGKAPTGDLMTAPAAAAAPPAQNPQHDRRWLILAVLGLVQLRVVLDATIVNIPLPTAQHALGFSNADRQWIVTGYALSFGSLLLLGGRLCGNPGPQ